VQKSGAPATAFSQGGYLAAKFMVDVLKTIKGEVTKDSVNVALRDMQPITEPMIGSPFVFGKGDAHAPNQASKMVKLENGKWAVATPDFITLPGA
jgi:branched-chain amino acid transport system substrate-binding protein